MAVVKCTICLRPVTFGRKVRKNVTYSICGLCDAKSRCEQIEKFRLDLGKDEQADSIRRIYSKFGSLQRKERTEAAWDWLWRRLYEHSIDLYESGINDIICKGFNLDCWEFYSDLIVENKIYFMLRKSSLVCLKPAWKSVGFFSGSFEGGKHR